MKCTFKNHWCFFFFFGVFYVFIWLRWVIAAGSMTSIVSCEVFCYGTQTL